MSHERHSEWLCFVLMKPALSIVSSDTFSEEISPIKKNDTSLPGNHSQRVFLDDLHPGQLNLGFAAAQSKLKNWCNIASKQNKPFINFAQTTLQKQFLKTALPVFIDNKGAMRLGDGHHKCWALRSISKAHDLKFTISVSIKGNFRGLTDSQYQTRLHELFPICGIAEHQRLANVASSFENMEDSPLRSIVGLALKKLGISSTWLLPMSQFAIGNHLLRHGHINRIDLNKRAAAPKDKPYLIPLHLSKNIERVANLFKKDDALRELLFDLAQTSEKRFFIAQKLGDVSASYTSKDKRATHSRTNTLLLHPLPSI